MNKLKERIKNNRIVKKTIENRAFLLLLTILLLFVFYSYFFKGFIYNIVNNDIDSIISFIYSFGGWSVVVFLILIVFEVVLAPVPGLILNVAGGLIFGSFMGGVLVLIGNVIGASICYFLARYLGGDYFKGLISEKSLFKFNKYLGRYGSLVLFFLRLNPFTSSDIFSYLGGLVNMRYRAFIVSTTLGLIPLVFALSYFGNYFLRDSIVFRLIFFIVSILYFSVFFYGLYKIGKNRVKNRLKR